MRAVRVDLYDLVKIHCMWCVCRVLQRALS